MLDSNSIFQQGRLHGRVRVGRGSDKQAQQAKSRVLRFTITHTKLHNYTITNQNNF